MRSTAFELTSSLRSKRSLTNEVNEIRAARKSFSHSGRAKNGARAKRWKEAGWGRGKKGTLARKPLDFEKPVRPRTGLLIGAA